MESMVYDKKNTNQDSTPFDCLQIKIFLSIINNIVLNK